MATYTWTGTSTSVFATAGNWSPSGPPTTGDTAIFDQNATKDCAGANNSATLLASLKVYEGFTFSIGTQATPLQIGATSLEIGLQVDSGATGGGDQRIVLDVGTNQTAAVIVQTGIATPDAGLENLRLKGSHASNVLTVINGIVGIGTNAAGDTATFATISVTGGRVNIGSGVTWTTINATDDATVNLFAGGASTTINLSGNARLASYGNYLIDAMNMTGSPVFTCSHRKSSGASITTLTRKGGMIDFSNHPGTLTVTTFNIGAGTIKLSSSSQLTVTTTTPTRGDFLTETVSLS